MPRTKRPVKKPDRFLEGVDLDKKEALKKLDKLVIEQKKRIDDRAQMEVRNIDLAFKILVGSISQKYMQMTVGQLKKELYLKEVTNPRSASHDDGYMTEGSQGSGDRGKKQMAPPSASIRSVSRLSRSVDASCRKQTGRSVARTGTAPRRRSKSAIYRTPALNKHSYNAYPTITPKVAPNTPLALLRQPRDGEMVVSMTGSPLMVPTNSSKTAQAHCDFQLTDGTVLSLQPTQLRESQAFIPHALIDSHVLSQLETLKNSLDKVLKLGKKK